MKQPCVYILASKHNSTLYVCVTSDIICYWEDKTGLREVQWLAAVHFGQ